MWDCLNYKTVDKKAFLANLESIRKILGTYERYEFGIKYIMPRAIHQKIMEVIQAVNRCEKVSAYFTEIRDVHNALIVLNNPKIMNNQAMAAKAFGVLFVALAKILARLPYPASGYAGPVKVFGEHFEGIVRTLAPSTHGSGISDEDFRDFLNGGQNFIRGSSH